MLINTECVTSSYCFSVVCRLAVTTVFSGATNVTSTTTSGSHAALSSATSSTAKTTTVAPQSQTSTQITADVALTSPQTPTEEKTHPSNTPPNTTISQTFDVSVTQSETVPSTSASLNVTSGTTVNATTLSDNKGNYNLAGNPGLVAVICIFSIVLGLLLVVIMVKCVTSSRSKFERLEDVPMVMNEASPFAQYSK
uniref:Cell wall integrity and stress response component 4 n=1 Tax=Fundulus heteroclitus TaxID=8078 RepID=A0A3Q2PPG7_FUNHE